MEHEEWKWQTGKAWYGIGIYHVTLTIPSRAPLFGELVIPENDPQKAWVKRTEFGDKVTEEALRINHYYPEIRVIQHCLMPDHLHVIYYVTKPMKKSIKAVVRGLWQGVKKIGRGCREMSRYNPDGIDGDMSGYNPDGMDGEMSGYNPDGMNGEMEGGKVYRASIFNEMPFIRPMSRRGQLKTMIRYVQMNPQRLATKRIMPELFWVQDNIEIAGRSYKGVGNADLLQRARYMPVHVRGTWVENAEIHGDDKEVREYMNKCIIEARKGAVMVSPFISKYEQMVMVELLKEGLPFIYIADNGFREYYKPQESLFDAVARKQVLILSPWEYDAKMRRVSRSRCVEMNNLAAEISREL